MELDGGEGRELTVADFEADVGPVDGVDGRRREWHCCDVN
jgi:hypothetical protein